jgi:hypothetical protein
VFVVGTYPGPDQLGEGFGSSLSMAEFRVRIPTPYRVSDPSITPGGRGRPTTNVSDANTTGPIATAIINLTGNTLAGLTEELALHR